MTNLALWSLLVGALTPLVVAVVQQPKWTSRARAIVAVISSIVLGTGTAFFNGTLTGTTIAASVGTVLVTALTTYRNLWVPTGLVPAIEAATSPTTQPTVANPVVPQQDSLH